MIWKIFLFSLSLVSASEVKTLEADAAQNHTRNNEQREDSSPFLTKVSPLGDIRLTEEQERLVTDFNSYPTYKWPRGIAIYWFQRGQFSSWEEQEIRDAIRDMNCKLENVWIKEWKSWDDGEDYITFHKGNGCWSYVGRTGGEQKLSLGEGCIWRHTIQHEIMHALGFTHTQCRHDRDNYVKILWENISEDWQGAYRKAGNDFIDIGPYDYYSVMHYPHWSPSHQGKDAFVVPDGVDKYQLGKGDKDIGGLTKDDVIKIDKAYAP